MPSAMPQMPILMHQLPLPSCDALQTKVKSVLVDFLVGAGIKVESVTSYNHLGEEG